jgi:branched-chain amino acid transport system permease protein
MSTHPSFQIPAAATLRVEVATASSRWLLAGGVALLLVLLSLPWWGDSSLLRQITELACLVIMAQMWNLLSGYGGLTSIGQQGYIGIGGYTLIVLANFAGVNPFLCVPLAGVVALAISFPASRALFRLRDGYFAIGTWAVAEIFRLLVANQPLLGGGSGTSLTAFRGVPRATRESMTYWLAVGIAFATIALVYLLLRSKYGLALIAVRDSEVASESQGVHVRRMKLAVYMLSAFGFGVAGALFFLLSLRISPDAAFGVQWTPTIVFMVIIGGIGTIEGPLLGALLYFVLSKFFSDYGTWYMVVLGLVAIVVTIRYPRGLWGWVSQRFGLRLFPIQRRLFTGPPEA